MRNKVLRHGDKSTANADAKELNCLYNFWALEEQLGLRSTPEDRFLEEIPQITLEGRTHEE